VHCRRQLPRPGEFRYWSRADEGWVDVEQEDPIVPLVTPIPAQLFLALMYVSALALAVWMIIRFKRLGPRSLTGGVFALLTAFALIIALPPVMDGVIATGIPQPRLVLVFVLALPAFTYFFLAGGWFMRSLLQRPGHFN
jgi:hypothetical protein